MMSSAAYTIIAINKPPWHVPKMPFRANMCDLRVHGRRNKRDRNVACMEVGEDISLGLGRSGFERVRGILASPCCVYRCRCRVLLLLLLVVLLMMMIEVKLLSLWLLLYKCPIGLGTDVIAVLRGWVANVDRNGWMMWRRRHSLGTSRVEMRIRQGGRYSGVIHPSGC
jgi:hypothetical protein